MEYEHLSAQVPGPGQYYPRKYYPHVKMLGIKESHRQYPYFLTGPGKPKPKSKKKLLPREQWKHPEQLRFTTFKKIKMNITKKGKDGI